MKEIFYGAAIQGAKDRAERASINRLIVEVIQDEGFDVFSLHTTGRSKEETATLLQQAIGLVPDGMSRSEFIRSSMLQGIDRVIATVFEMSIPSLGVGIEFHHACTRRARGMPEIPILALYQKGFWPFGLSTMVTGITHNNLPSFHLAEYEEVFDLEDNLRNFLSILQNQEN